MTQPVPREPHDGIDVDADPQTAALEHDESREHTQPTRRGRQR